jgi:hypothetical protein
MKIEIYELNDRIKQLEKEVDELKKPYRCEICGKPTDGWVKTLCFTTYLCKEHYPPYVTGGYY